MVSGQWSVEEGRQKFFDFILFLTERKINMPGLQSYKDLKVWQKSIDLTLLVYKATSAFPKEEMFGLTSQLRRASVSIASNIAEGQSRGTQDFKRFLTISQGSLSEVETQLLIARKLEYFKEEPYLELVDACAEIGRMLNGLHKSLS